MVTLAVAIKGVFHRQRQSGWDLLCVPAATIMKREDQAQRKNSVAYFECIHCIILSMLCITDLPWGKSDL